jgi:hypothetical protein
MGSPYPANTSRNNIASALTAFQILTGAEKTGVAERVAGEAADGGEGEQADPQGQAG